MRILDRYILRNVTTPIIFCAYTLILLFLIADVFDHLSEIISNRTSLILVARYYALLIPFAFVQVIPWATFLGLIYVFTVLSKNSELTAMKASGQQVIAIATPLIFLGFAISVITFVISDRVVPPTYQRAEDIKLNHIEYASRNPSKGKKLKNLTLLTEEKQYFIKLFDTASQEIQDVRIHYLSQNYNVIKRLVAKQGKWQDDKWVLSKVSIYELGPERKIIGEPVFMPKYTFQDSSLTPEDLIKAAEEASIKSLHDFRGTIEKLKENGLDYRIELVDLHEKISAPWMNLGIVLLTLPFLAISKVRQGMAITIIVCLGLVFIYHILFAVGLAIGKTGKLPPLISAWIAHFLVIVIAFG